MLKYLINKIAPLIRNHSSLYMDDPRNIDPSASLNNVKLVGNIKIGRGCKIREGVTILGDVKIGNYTSINGPGTDLRAKIYPIEIGNFCSFARNTMFQEYNHRHDRLSTSFINQNIFGSTIIDDITSKGPIIIGHDVWIGAQSIVLSGVKIGNGAVIAANSVVNKDIPPFAIAAGSPATVLGYRFDEECVRMIQELEWWFWDIEKIRSHRIHFNQPVNSEMLRKIEELQ
jgi:virginiamycin A acetyltransferase